MAAVSKSETFETLRPLLFSIAYRMLSSVGDAEDVVQESYLRYRGAVDDGVRVDSLKAYLSAVVTRLALDQLRSARVRRETYAGDWLPEPLVSEHDGGDPAAYVDAAETLSMAFLLVLERLNPVERAVFVLHDVFGYDYSEVSAIVDRTDANCRQIAARARRHVQAERPRFDTSPEERERLGARFFAAVTTGEIKDLIDLLAADVVVCGDGGGKVPQWTHPIAGADQVARLFEGLGRQIRDVGVTVQVTGVNGQPGAICRDPDGKVAAVFALDIYGGAVQTIRSVINPDKLRHLGEVADVRALARGRRRPSNR